MRSWSVPAVHDVLSKSLGSDNAINIVHATVAALQMLEPPEAVAARRGLPLEDVAPAAMLRAQAAGAGCVMAQFKVTQRKSEIGGTSNQRNTLRSLGLKRIGDTVSKKIDQSSWNGEHRFASGGCRGGLTNMTLKVHHLRPHLGPNRQRPVRVAVKASKGKTAGRGTKGTKARYQVPAVFEGGQMPLAHAICLS